MSKLGYPEGTPKAVHARMLSMDTPYHEHRIHIGNEKYLTDYTCGLGANLIDIQNCYSLPSEDEESLAFKLTELFPCIEKVKILKTGTDACNCAVRIARAYAENSGTKGLDVDGLGVGYHGWSDTFISDEYPGIGCIAGQYEKCNNFNMLLQRLNNQPADMNYKYCIIEPVELDLNVKDELLEIRRLCSEKGIILIFDEIITGMRFPEYSVSNYFGIQPDLICLGKGLGNGYPISIVGGPSHIMETPGYFVSGTFFGELSGINAALATLDFLDTGKLNELWSRGQEVITHFNEISDKIQLYGYPTRCIWKGEEVFIATFCQQMQKRGYLLHLRVWFITHAHTSTINAQFIDESKQCINEIIDKNIQLKGAVPEPVFKR